MNALRVKDKGKEMKVEIYSKSHCPFCEKAKSWFKQHGYEFTEYKLDNEEERLAFYQRVPGARSVPQIFIDDKLIGTYDQFMEVSEQFVKKRSGGLMVFSETYKPFHYPWAVEITTRHEKVHWIEDELDLSEDVADWKSGKVSAVEKEYITNILRLFTQSDVAVGQNYYDQLIPKFKNNEVRNMLGSFANREAIHQRAYALLNETLGLSDAEYHAFLEYTEMADKIEFMMDSDPNTVRGLAMAMAKSVMNEGIALFASFVMLLNFQRYGKMKGMGKVVEWSIRDESIHVEGIAKLFKAYCAEHPKIVDDEFKAAIYEMARQAVKLEDNFVDLAYKLGDIEGLEEKEVKQYVRYITDRRLIQLGLKGNYKVKDNPLPWLEWVLNGADHTNFFENRVTEYEVAGLSGKWDDVYETEAA
jgi:ribonucleotide reductase beta subunit family protein with ferritin-like domain